MSPLFRNVLANAGGQAVATVVGFITVPIFLHLLGPQGYGLVSLLVVLQSMTAALDFGLSATANREVATYLALGRPVPERRDLVRTLELFYLGIAVALFLLFGGSAGWLARHWVTDVAVEPGLLASCLFLGGSSIALRWPIALYRGILRGSERQVLLNGVSAVATLLRGFGSIVVLLTVARTPLVFYWSQLGFALAELAIFRGALLRVGGGFEGQGGAFDPALLRSLWRFTVNVGGLAVFALVLKQFDKVVISTMLPIAQLGYYNAATLASNGLTKIAIPVQVAAFPRLTQHHQRGEVGELARTFHATVQLVAFIASPLAFVLIFFAPDVLRVWTRDAQLASAAGPALATLSGAVLLSTLMSIPFSLLVAAGLTWIPLALNGIGAAVAVPLTIWLTRAHGITGAATAWLVFNIFNFLAMPLLMFPRVLPGEHRAWLTRDTLPFLLVPMATFGAARLATGSAGLPWRIVAIGLAGLAYAAVVLRLNRELGQRVKVTMQGLVARVRRGGSPPVSGAGGR